MNLIENIKEISQQPIEEAVSLPFGAYSDGAFHEMEKEKIFRSDWVFVCNEAELKEPGQYYAFTLADEPVVVIRGRDGTLRAMSNACRHRGTVLNDPGFGKQSRMICPYHAWTYTDEGKLIGVPHPGDIEVKKEDHCLPHFKLESWHGLVFINLDGSAEPLAERYAGVDAYLKRYNIDKFTHGGGGEEEQWAANWKLAMENAMESYHLFKVHKETLETVTPTKHAFLLEGEPNWSVSAGDVAGTTFSGAMTKLMTSLMPKKEKKLMEHYVLVSLPPSFVGILIYDTFGYIAIRPTDAENSIIRGGNISKSGRKQTGTEEAFTEKFFAEDKWICERNQQSMKSSVAKGGKLVALERIVTDFHQYLAERVFGVKTSSRYVMERAEEFKES